MMTPFGSTGCLHKAANIGKDLSNFDMLHVQHNNIMASIGLAGDKAGTALHIFRSTGNLMLEIEAPH